MIDSLAALALVAVVALISMTFGRAVLAWLGLRVADRSEGAVLGAGVGLGVLVYAMVLLGAADLYRPATAWGLLAALVLLSGREWRTWRGWLPWSWIRARARQASWAMRATLAVLLMYGGTYTLVALTPTLEGDSLAGYLLTAREYARLGGLAAVDHAYTDTYPANGQMLSTLGFLLGGQIVAQLLVVWLTGLVALGSIYALGRQWFSRRAALLGMTVWYGMYAVSYLAASGKIDLAWAAFDLLALLSFARWYFAEPDPGDRRWLILAGFFLGLAGGTKQASLFTGAILALAVAVRLRPGRERRWGAWVAASLFLVVPALPALIWPLRAYVQTGGVAAPGEGLINDSGLVGFARTIWFMSMLGNMPSVEGPLGKSVGPALLATVPMLSLCLPVDRRVRHVCAFSAAMMVLWFQGVQRARHLLPTLGLLALVAGYVTVYLLARRPRLGQLIVLLTLASLAVNGARWGYVNFISITRLPFVLGRLDFDGYLAANLPKLRWYPNYHMITSARTHLPADARIAALSTSNSFYLERPFYSRWSQTPRDVPNAEAFAANLQAAGITHVLTNDYVVRKRGWEDAWLLDARFQARYMKRLLCRDGQCLYEFVTGAGARP